MDNGLGDFLRAQRERAGLSIRALARTSGGAISHGYLANLERGVDPRTGKALRPSAAILYAVAPLYGTDVPTLLRVAGYAQAAAAAEATPVGGDAPEGEKSDGGAWETLATQLAASLDRQLAIMEADKITERARVEAERARVDGERLVREGQLANERLRIEKVDAVHADAIRQAQVNMSAVLAEMRSPHGDGLVEPEAAPTGNGR